MSEFRVEVAKVLKVQKHPNADTLSMAEVNGYPVIFRTGDYSEGQLAVHIPIDSIVPDKAEWAFLGGHNRIKAKRLRGIFSMGLLAPALPDWKEGQNVQEKLGIIKYEVPESILMGTENEADPGFIPVYTDIEGLRRWPDVLVEGEMVTITEKIHGANARYIFHDDRLWVGSHTQIKKFNESNLWWKAAIEAGLEEKLKTVPDLVFYGEVYGQVQDLKYGINSGVRLRFFDALNIKTNTYLDYDLFRLVCAKQGLETVPELYNGPWHNDLRKLAEGKSIIPGADNVREGFVVRPIVERIDTTPRLVTRVSDTDGKETERVEFLNRVILKFLGEGYLLRKGA